MIKMLYIVKYFILGGYKELLPFVSYVLLGVLFGVLFTILCMKNYQNKGNIESQKLITDGSNSEPTDLNNAGTKNSKDPNKTSKPAVKNLNLII